MNCKPGDLAIVVRSEAGNLGRIVRCVRFVGAIPWDKVAKDYWLVDGEMSFVWRASGAFAGKRPYAPDSYLRPIRDQDGEDETLTWAPRKETA